MRFTVLQEFFCGHLAAIDSLFCSFTGAGFVAAVRRFDFLVGKAIQAFAFLLPHLLLLTINLDFWPILIPQFVAGWLFGWLCHRSGSILPRWFAHTLSNVLGAWRSS